MYPVVSEHRSPRDLWVLWTSPDGSVLWIYQLKEDFQELSIDDLLNDENPAFTYIDVIDDVDCDDGFHEGNHSR